MQIKLGKHLLASMEVLLKQEIVVGPQTSTKFICHCELIFVGINEFIIFIIMLLLLFFKIHFRPNIPPPCEQNISSETWLKPKANFHL